MKTWRSRVAALALLLPLGLVLAQSAPPVAPVAPVRDQVDSWHGVQVHDRQVKIAMRERADGPERVLVDPDVLARSTGVPHAVNWWVPSWDGRYLAYGLSAGGSEDASLIVLDVQTGQAVGEPVTRVPAGGVSWLPDSRTVAFNRLRQLTAEDAAIEQYLDSAVHLLMVGEPVDPARAVFGPTVSRDLGLRRLDNGRLLFAPGSPWVVAASNDTTQREGSVFVARVEELAGGRPGAAWRASMTTGSSSSCAATSCST